MNIEEITRQAWGKTIEEAVISVIESKWGHGIESEVKTAIKDTAREICQTSEIREAIKNRIIHWITNS